MKPYTYLIGWPELDRWYYGVRYAQNCDPSDFWNPYTTSSRHVKEFVTKHGDPPVKLIRKTFNDKKSARLWENRVLKRMKVVNDDKWLNEHDSMAPPINPYGNLAMRRPENREKARLNNGGSGNPMYGKLQKRISCPHCNKIVSVNTYARWHGKNCLLTNPDAFRPTGKNNPSYGKQPASNSVGCCYCHKICDIRNFHRHHGDKCKMNLSKIVGNTDKAVYNNLVGNHLRQT